MLFWQCAECGQVMRAFVIIQGGLIECDVKSALQLSGKVVVDDKHICSGCVRRLYG